VIADELAGGVFAQGSPADLVTWCMIMATQKSRRVYIALFVEGSR
jgi:hypothetical protein